MPCTLVKYCVLPPMTMFMMCSFSSTLAFIDFHRSRSLEVFSSAVGHGVRYTVAFRPKVHRVSPVTSIVHWVSCSFLGNHDKITINGNTAVAGLKFFAFLGLFGSKIAP